MYLPIHSAVLPYISCKAVSLEIVSLEIVSLEIENSDQDDVKRFNFTQLGTCWFREGVSRN